MKREFADKIILPYKDQRAAQKRSLFLAKLLLFLVESDKIGLFMENGAMLMEFWLCSIPISLKTRLGSCKTFGPFEEPVGVLQTFTKLESQRSANQMLTCSGRHAYMCKVSHRFRRMRVQIWAHSAAALCQADEIEHNSKGCRVSGVCCSFVHLSVGERERCLLQKALMKLFIRHRADGKEKNRRIACLSFGTCCWILKEFTRKETMIFYTSCSFSVFYTTNKNYSPHRKKQSR